MSPSRAVALVVPAGVRSARSALVVLALLLVAAGVHAEEVMYSVHGKVTQASGLAEVVSALQAHGVVPDADVLFEYTLESTVEGAPSSVNAELTQYSGAIVSMRVSIGTYECVLFVGGPFPNNLVLVGDDVLQGTTLFDKYSLATWGTDTDRLLFGDVLPVFMAAGVDIPFGMAISDEDLLHDPKEFGYFQGQLKSNKGTIDFVFDFDGTGPGPDPDPVDPTLAALARQGQIKAAATFARSVLGARKRGVAAPPTKDPGGVKQDAAVAKAGEVFDTRFAKAVSKALAKGGNAPLAADDASLAKATLLAGLTAVADSVVVGVDADVKSDRALRGKILGAVAKSIGKDLSAHAQDVRKPSPATLASRLAKSEAALVNALGKALASKARGSYGGASAQQVAAAIDSLVAQYVLLTLGTGLR